MTNFLKDVYETFGQRLRSPILGSIFLFILILNWQSFFYLFFADATVAMRLRFFNLNTDPYSLYVWPGILGPIFSLIVLPWAKPIGALAASRPVKWLKKLEGAAASEHRILQLQWAADEKSAADRITVDRAKLVDEVRSEIVDEELRSETEAELRSRRTSEADQTQLSDLAAEILIAMAESKDGSLSKQRGRQGGRDFYGIVSGPAFGGETHKDLTASKTAIEELSVKKLVVHDINKASWSVTQSGYNLASQLN